MSIRTKGLKKSLKNVYYADIYTIFAAPIHASY